MLGDIVLADPRALQSFLKAAVAEAFAAVLDSHHEEVRELRRGLFATKGLLTAHEAGDILGGVTAETVMTYVRDQGLPCYKPGRRPLFRLADLDTWVVQFPDVTGSSTA